MFIIVCLVLFSLLLKYMFIIYFYYYSTTYLSTSLRGPGGGGAAPAAPGPCRGRPASPWRGTPPSESQRGGAGEDKKNKEKQ